MEWVHGVLVTKGYVLGQFTVASAPTKRAMEYRVQCDLKDFKAKKYQPQFRDAIFPTINPVKKISGNQNSGNPIFEKPICLITPALE